MSMNLSAPVQCSEDVPDQPPIQSDRSVTGDQSPSSQRGRAEHDTSVQLDAERMDQSGAAERQSAQENPPGASATGYLPPPAASRDRIVLTGRSGDKIEAEGLASALQSGGTFQLANEINTTIYHHGDSLTPRKSAGIKNKYSLTDSTAEPTIQHLDVISAGLAGDWDQLGRELGLAEPTLQQIRLDYQAEGQHEVNYRVLARWKQQAGNTATLQMLAKALKKIGRGDLADELRRG